HCSYAAGASRQYLTIVLRKSISSWKIPSADGACFYTVVAPEKQGKTRVAKEARNAAQHQRTLRRDGDGRSGPARGGEQAGFARRHRAPPGDFALLSGTIVRQAAPRRPGAQRARSGRRLSPVAS